ncbi:hypothetical protein HYS03_02755 [Candidatus Woesebacteria bacterium]|nr:hypothetical protein [Candidatus Woesebacteria bacterium]QQG47242.1 MAG: hypothetical protein HY044_03895 [Candidatus Woesebacteria bacterium]
MDPKKGKRNSLNSNFLEGLKEIGSETFRGKNFVDQIFGIPSKHFSSEIAVGEQILVSEILSGKHEENQKERKQIFYEKTLLVEEKMLIEKKNKELEIRLQAIMKEIQNLANATPKLTKELEMASIGVVVDPGPYHLVFLEKILEFIKSFRKKVEDASIWLASANKRTQKKTYWNLYKQHGGKFLLSSEHYLQRSAG